MKQDQSAAPVRLLKTNKYLTYQFYGEMFHHALKAEEGIRYAALACYSWLRRRLEGNVIPEELLMPGKEEYGRVSDEKFRSFSISGDHIIEVESDLDEGLWALRIIENDLGALDDPVAGRTIQSDIAFRVIDRKLECGFRTTISDKEDVKKAECIRFSLVKELANDPLFGLKQVERIFDHTDNLCEEDALDDVYSLYLNRDNQLPLVFYSYDDFSEDEQGYIGSIDQSKIYELKRKSIRVNVLKKSEAYASRYAGIARPYFLASRLFPHFDRLFHSGPLKKGDVIVIEPKRSGGRIRIYDYEDKDAYRNELSNFTRDRDIDFRDVLFAEEAKLIIERKNEDFVSGILSQLEETERSLESFRNKIERNDRMLSYQKNSQPSQAKEMEELVKKLEKSEQTNIVFKKEIDLLNDRLNKKDDYISYLERRLRRPLKHAGIADHVRDYRYVVLDKKAVACLERNDAENVDLDLICDSLDYLEYLYSQYLFEGMERDVLNNKSSEIYNRPFEVSPSGIPSSASGACKIRYRFADGVTREYPLDWHLKAGNHGELIRIYFLIDKEKKKMVVGSLPNHLTY